MSLCGHILYFLWTFRSRITGSRNKCMFNLLRICSTVSKQLCHLAECIVLLARMLPLWLRWMALVCGQREGGVEVTGGVGGFFVSHLMFWIPIPVPNWLGWHSKNTVFFLFTTNILLFSSLWTLVFCELFVRHWNLEEYPYNDLELGKSNTPTTLCPVMEYCGPAFRKWVKSERCVGGRADIFKRVVWVCVEKEN